MKMLTCLKSMVINATLGTVTKANPNQVQNIAQQGQIGRPKKEELLNLIKLFIHANTTISNYNKT